MLIVKTTSQFKTDFKRMIRTGNDPALFWSVVELLVSEEKIPNDYRDHDLQGEWAGVRDIHVEPDWLLFYKISAPYLILISTGTHSELF